MKAKPAREDALVLLRVMGLGSLEGSLDSLLGQTVPQAKEVEFAHLHILLGETQQVVTGKGAMFDLILDPRTRFGARGLRLFQDVQDGTSIPS